MKVLSTEGLTKLIDLIKSSFISNADTEEVTEIDTETVSEVTLATVATTGSYNDLSDKPTVDQTYDGTSANAQSGVAVASAISGKADDNAVVHLAGTETITGTKTLEGTGWITHIKNNEVTYNTAPSSDTSSAIAFVDKNGEAIGVVECFRAPDNTTRTQLNTRCANGSWSSQALQLHVASDGTSTAFAPASDVNWSIVTTVSKSKAQTGYFELGNGLIVNWGKGTIPANATSASVTFPKAFSSGTSYSVITVHNGSATTATMTRPNYPTATGFDCYYNAAHTSSRNFYWIAIGY